MESPEHDQKDINVVAFLVRIVRTIFIGFFWGIINIFFGLYLGFGIPEESTTGRMIFFYSFFVITLAAYLYFLFRMWRKKQ